MAVQIKAEDEDQYIGIVHYQSILIYCSPERKHNTASFLSPFSFAFQCFRYAAFDI